MVKTRVQREKLKADYMEIWVEGMVRNQRRMACCADWRGNG